MQIMHNLMPGLVAAPGPRPRPPEPSTVARVSHALGRGPRAWELVPVAVDLVAELLPADLVPGRFFS